MKKLVLLAGAALMLAPAAFASPDKNKKAAPATPEKVKCAVMADHEVSVKEATEKKMYADYKGNRYFFCCGGCPAAFKKDPGKFVKADHIKTPKAEKVKKG
jgi:YHS domain-containing protein